MPDRCCIADWPVTRFRPWDADAFELFRYEEPAGAFVPDDGKESLAFFGRSGRSDGGYSGAPCAWLMNPPRRQNVLGTCEDHVILRDPVTPRMIGGLAHYGPDYPDYGSHPNVRAGEAAMAACSARYSCANGRVRGMHERTDPAGCALCEHDALGHRIIQCSSHAAQLRMLIEGNEKQHGELTRNLEENKMLREQLQQALQDKVGLLDRLLGGRA